MDRISINTISQVIQKGVTCPLQELADVVGISIDSRTTQKNELFFAIQGKRLDGHQFVGQALAQGAAACVVKRGEVSVADAQRLLEVDDVNQALLQFARWYRQQQTAQLISITGSVGKTTTRTMIYTALSSCLSGVQSPANFNNEFGVPLSIAAMEATHQFAVLELAASQVGEIQELSEIALPQIGVITGIGRSHLEHFGTLQQTAETKGALFEALPTAGLAVVCGDDPFADYLVSRTSARTVRVGLGENNDLQAVLIAQNQQGISFRVNGQLYLLPVVGRHFINAALAAIAVARELGISEKDVSESLRNYATVPGRCHRMQIGDWTVIDDTYNASPDSMRAACQVLRDYVGTGKRIMVMGDMLELGPETEGYHREMGTLAVESGIDLLFACGGQAESVAQGARSAGMAENQITTAPDVELLALEVTDHLEPGDVVLVKGSRGMRMERLLQHLQQTVSDGKTTGTTKISCV
ncbi:UDP-N-acetylmuramoyl-tripeptide--D-alanyl-D-alanine ligase [Gimesia sp.]|uniref:UDP-N-acetylmuramoyl-tripeptide--D-alanyl-D- alanine ligase n=1 Tax=Gimesia sp. TaxID=2024833 RepID=UPI000C60AA29|nr:UDP-N-acetylmuramoyl-tripeptide--D-alanyl-D-alanine ligase [Gimesia sp.]MAX40545.1 UDP-N-acetylmuramoylalanyl-D-glutamyl-2, 6-diaminopimelate--D-alanyl-D-alanine ligase [Gimesia sp.]HBL44321.1 UDP-N-acetylmuramoyl-tripeptide--D-alanyl-D-alanine ligase [Planctomycetaceae bacterium]|tara:strand:- start:2827 stop:4239 length:1413 start_codon:yes stop_codon:yes gene_type:complete